MTFNIVLPAGEFVVGSWGEGMDYTHTSDDSIIENVNWLGFAIGDTDGDFQFPAGKDFGNPRPLFGGNVSFSSIAPPPPPIPVPAAIWLFGTALIGLFGFSKRRKAA